MTNWTTPTTATAGGTITAAHWNTEVRDNTTFLYDTPMCTLGLSSAQSISNNTIGNPLAVNGAIVLDNNNMGTATAAICINTPGIYDISASFAWQTNATGQRYAQVIATTPGPTNTVIAEDGPKAAVASSEVGHVLAGRWMFPANGTKTPCGTITVQVLQTSGGALNIGGTATPQSVFGGNCPAWLSARFVGGTI